MIAVTEFEELQVSILTVGVVLDTFQTTEQQCSTHYVKVVAQWIHQLYQIFRLVSFQTFVVSSSSKRVVHYFIESTTNQLF